MILRDGSSEDGGLLIVWGCTIIGAASVSVGAANRILLNKLCHVSTDL